MVCVIFEGCCINVWQLSGIYYHHPNWHNIVIWKYVTGQTDNYSSMVVCNLGLGGWLGTGARWMLFKQPDMWWGKTHPNTLFLQKHAVLGFFLYS